MVYIPILPFKIFHSNSLSETENEIKSEDKVNEKDINTFGKPHS